MPRIVVNLSRIGNEGTGLQVFSKNVLESLLSIVDDVDVIVSRNVDVGSDAKIVRVPAWMAMTPVVSRVRPLLWLLYALFLFPERTGKILSTTHHGVPGAKRQIITIHDIRPYFHPDSFLQFFYFRYLLPRLARGVDGVLTVSEASRRLIIGHYRVAPDKIFVVPNCVNVSRFKPGRNGQTEEPPYLLMIGATWTHKNAHEVLRMASFWHEKYRLKIVSGSGAYRSKLEKIAMESGVWGRVDFLSHLGDEALVALYRGARALVYPSLMEGFGIPPLEAMACGIPVIVSDIPVFRETYGDVPIYVLPGDPSSWQKAFDALEYPMLVRDKIQRGGLLAASYSIERMGAALREAISGIWPDLAIRY